jgi:hypothetical protein
MVLERELSELYPGTVVVLYWCCPTSVTVHAVSYMAVRISPDRLHKSSWGSANTVHLFAMTGPADLCPMTVYRDEFGLRNSAQQQCDSARQSRMSTARRALFYYK